MKKTFFISDLHLGLYPEQKSKERERIIVNWLDQIKHEAEEIYLLGDIFDFWHEYKHVVPKGFVRFLGKLAELSDMGVRLYYFSGNHDVWVYGYFEEELGAKILHAPLIKNINGINLFMAHGDGLGKGDNGYKWLKKCFRNRFLQFLFARLHPNFAMWIGKTWSKNSRYSKGIFAEKFNGFKKELLVQYAIEMSKHESHDLYIFGHRHVPYDVKINKKARVINLGDWIVNFTYGELEGKNFAVKQIDGKDELIHKEEITIP